VNIYLGMVPELPIAMLACARIGAPHSVVFGGFSAEALKDRINDAQAKVLITADGGYRRGAVVPLKQNAEDALKETPTIEHVVTVRRTRSEHPFVAGRDHWYHELIADQPAECPPEPMDAEDLLYLLYTSGTTGKPKGIVHTTGGYLTGVSTTHRMIFDIHDDDVYWCAADIGWVTGHSYIVYGPLANHTTGILYEGAPDWPDKDRLWDIAERYKATILYTAPTAIRAFMRWGTEYPEKHDLTSLRLLGSVGEPINPEAWVWYWKYIGGERCPVVDTWWQTGDRADPHHAASGHHALEAGVGDVSVPRDPGGRGGRAGSFRSARRRRIPRASAAVARDVPHDLRGSGPVRGELLRQVRQRHVSRRRRREARRGWVLLVAREDRRRDERRGAPALHFRDRIRARG
jgi:acyl-coenzyme A synthetase/AMP-(fatty) acid ligase